MNSLEKLSKFLMTYLIIMKYLILNKLHILTSSVFTCKPERDLGKYSFIFLEFDPWGDSI